MAFFRSLVEQREFSLGKWEAWLDSLDARTTEAGISVNDANALTWSVVWGCIQVKAQDIAKSPLPLYRRLGRKGEDGREEAKDHPLWQIFRVAANPRMTAYTFRSTMQKHLEVRGNAYALIDRDRSGDVTALWPRQPSRMEPRVEDGRLFYRYTPESGTRIDYEPERVFHLRGLSDDGIIGISPVEVYRDGIGLGLAYQKHAGKTFKNGCRQPWHIEFGPETGQDKALEAMEKFRAAYAGIENSGKIMGLYGGMVAKGLGFTNRDSEFLDSRHFAVEEGCRVWRVPPPKVMDFLRATFSNITEINIGYVNDTLRPIQENWEQEIYLQLLRPEERSTYYVEHDNYDLLKGTPRERADIEVSYVNNGISKINEVRQSHNWKPVPGGEKNRTQMQNIPLEQADEQAQQSPPPKQPPQQGGRVNGKATT